MAAVEKKEGFPSETLPYKVAVRMQKLPEMGQKGGGVEGWRGRGVERITGPALRY